MTKKNFTFLVIGIVFGLLFSIGLCMALLPEWNAFTPGVVCTAIGLIGLIGLAISYRKQSGKGPIKIDPKIAGRVVYGTISALIMGLGMCMIMVWKLMIPGIIVGTIGLLGVAAAYPLYLHITKKERERIAPEVLRLSEELLK